MSKLSIHCQITHHKAEARVPINQNSIAFSLLQLKCMSPCLLQGISIIASNAVHAAEASAFSRLGALALSYWKHILSGKTFFGITFFL
jgi:hypothetical protein